MDELLNFENLQAVLEEYGKAIAEQYKKNLIRDGRPTTDNKLIKSIKTRVVAKGNEYVVQMSLEEYWKYIEYGTKGRLTGNFGRKFPPLPEILHWIEVKPSLPRPANINEWNRMAYLIGRKIRDFGTQGRADLTEAEMEVTEQWRQRIEDALRMDVVNYVQQVIAGTI